MKNYEDLIRKSVRKDFNKANFKRNGRAPKPPHPVNTKRVISIHPGCDYYRYRKYFIGKLVRVEPVTFGLIGSAWCEFVNESDRAALVSAGGWSQDKRRFLLNGAKFDD